MGKNPFESDRKLNFELNNSYGISHTYNPLHDPHLKNWVNSLINRAFLQRQGLITEDKDVICRLTEYNEYRRFLLRIYNDTITRTLEIENAENEDRKRIEIANFNHKKELIRKLKLLNYDKSKPKSQNVSSIIIHIKIIIVSHLC